jgi:hypothetical protein
MRILARLKKRINSENRKDLERAGVSLLFQTELVDIIGLEAEDTKILKGIDFIKDFRESEKGVVLYNETLFRIGIHHLQKTGLFGAGVSVSILDSGIFLQDLALKYSVSLHKDFTGEGLQDEIPHGTIISKLIQSIVPECSMLIGKVVNRFGELTR